MNTNPHSHLSCILFFHTTAMHTKLALVKAMVPVQVSRILVWSLWLQKYPSNELVSFSLLFFSQILISIHVTPLASAVLPWVHLNVTVPPNVTLWMAQPSLFCMRTAQNSKLASAVFPWVELFVTVYNLWLQQQMCPCEWLMFSQGWCFVEDKGNKCVMWMCEKSWFVNQEYYDRILSLK